MNYLILIEYIKFKSCVYLICIFVCYIDVNIWEVCNWIICFVWVYVTWLSFFCNVLFVVFCVFVVLKMCRNNGSKLV